MGCNQEENDQEVWDEFCEEIWECMWEVKRWILNKEPKKAFYSDAFKVDDILS